MAKKRQVSEEGRKRQGEAFKKMWQDPELRKKMIERNKKMWQDPEYKAKMAKVHTGRTLSDEAKEKIRQARLGSKDSPEIRKKKSEAAKRMWQDPELRARMIKARTGLKRSEEFKQKVRESNHRRGCSEITKQRIGDANRGKKRTDEVRAKLSAIQSDPDAIERNRARGIKQWKNMTPEQQQQKVEILRKNHVYCDTTGTRRSLETRKKMSETCLKQHDERSIRLKRQLANNPEHLEKLLAAGDRVRQKRKLRIKQAEYVTKYKTNLSIKRLGDNDRNRTAENDEALDEFFGDIL